jgi:hypothetical protein
MRIRGERSEAGVYLVDNSSKTRLGFTSASNSSEIAAKLRSEVCIDCPIYEIRCNGASGVDKGLVQTRLSPTKSKTVDNIECQIPGSVVDFNSMAKEQTFKK